MDDLESEIGHLAALIGTIADIAIEIPGSDPTMNRVNALLWIARDLSERLVDATTACHSKIIADRSSAPIRMVGGARS
ncbi:hypothetical protein [Pseudaminobacter soli (ex Li et al. 2025)]|nr:hypothetical protein [Mesorhizobium soli]